MEPVETRLKALMLAGLAGDAVAYRTLLGQLGDHLRRYYLRRLGRDRAADAEDLVQEALMAVHARRATYDTDAPFTAWVHAIARYKLVDHYRRRRIRATVPLDDADAVFAADAAGPAAARHDVERLLETLPDRPRTLIRMVRIEGQSVAETAAATGLSQSAVKVGIHRGIKALATRIRGRGDDDDK
ncbi:MAG: sigma-70 family RNA polymerase sigma factor [Rhodospirillales bacterium]